MNTHKEWFYEYEMYNGNVFLVYDLPKKITRHGRVKLLLNDGRIKTLGVLHIPTLASSLISVNKIADVGVQIVFEKDRCRMV